MEDVFYKSFIKSMAFLITGTFVFLIVLFVFFLIRQMILLYKKLTFTKRNQKYDTHIKELFNNSEKTINLIRKKFGYSKNISSNFDINKVFEIIKNIQFEDKNFTFDNDTKSRPRKSELILMNVRKENDDILLNFKVEMVSDRKNDYYNKNIFVILYINENKLISKSKCQYNYFIQYKTLNIEFLNLMILNEVIKRIEIIRKETEIDEFSFLD